MGNLDVRFHAHGRGELTSLGKSLQLHGDTFEAAHSGKSRVAIAAKKAELEALHSQLNPDFLYNTLGSFQTLAVMEGQDRLATYGLSFRRAHAPHYTLEPGTLVDLRQEVEHIEHLSLI